MSVLRGGTAAALVVVVLAAVATPAGAKPPQVRFTADVPATVTRGERLDIAGRVRGARSPRKLTIVLQQRVRRRWVKRAAQHPARDGRFHVRWTPGGAGTVTIRLLVRRGRTTLITGSRRTVQIRKPGGAPAPAPLPAPAPGPAPSPAPTATPTPTPGPVTSAPVAVPTSDRILALPAPGDPGDVRVSGELEIAPGDFLAVGAGSGAPHGFLGKATAVQSDNGDTLVTTEPATLPQVIPTGHLEYSADPGNLTGIQRTLHCTGASQITVDGSLELTPTVHLDATWAPAGGMDVTAGTTAHGELSLSASADGPGACTIDPVEIHRTALAPYTLFVGPVPVVVEPVIHVDLQGGGDVDAAASTMVTGTFDATTGLESGAFAPAFQAAAPVVGADAQIDATVTPTTELLLYGVPSASLDTRAGLRLHADGAWSVSARVTQHARVSAPVLGIDAGDRTVFEQEYALLASR